jgi:hypothetical protein
MCSGRMKSNDMNNNETPKVNFSRIIEYPTLQLAFRAFTESKSIITTAEMTSIRLLSMQEDARMRYIDHALGEVGKVLFSVIMLLNSDADKESERSEPFFETVRDNQNAWFRKLLEGFIEIANFEKSNEDLYFRHLLRIREYCTIMGSIENENTFYGCINKNKSNLCTKLYDQIVEMEKAMDLSKCWYLNERDRKPFNSKSRKKSRSRLSQLSSFNFRLQNTLNYLSAAEKLLVNFSYAGYGNASDSIHWSVGTPDSFEPTIKEGVILGGIHHISMMAIAIISRMHKLVDSKNEIVKMLSEELSENEISKAFLNDATNKNIEVGDLVSVPYGYGTVVNVTTSKFNYQSYEVYYINQPPIPEIHQDQFIAMHVKLLLKRKDVAARLKAKWKPMLDQISTDIPEDELQKIVEQAMLYSIEKNKNL